MNRKAESLLLGAVALAVTSCSDQATATGPEPEPLFINAKDAQDHIGEKVQVCGTTEGLRYSDDTEHLFISVGSDYPDPDRFTIVVFNFVGTDSWPDVGSYSCTYEPIVEYEGRPQVHVEDPERQILFNRDQHGKVMDLDSSEYVFPSD